MPQRILVSLALLLIVGAQSALSWGAFPLIEEIGRAVPGLRSPGFGGFAIADFDGDGKDDLALPGENGIGAVQIIQIIGMTPSGIGVKQSIISEGGYGSLLASSADGVIKLYLQKNNELQEFSGWPLQLVRTLPVAGMSGGIAVAIGDIDNDSVDELVFVQGDSAGYIRVISLATGATLWSTPNDRGRSVVLAQLDADPALEIVVDGLQIRVLDGATKAVEWSFYDGSYSCCLARGRFHNSNEDQFLAATQGGITTFHRSPYSIDWTYPQFDVRSTGAADLDLDGIDDVIEGDRTWGNVNVLDGSTGALRLTIPHSAYGISAVAGVNFSGIGEPSIAFSSDEALQQTHEVFRVVNSNTGATQWEILNYRPGPHSSTALFDLEGDGRQNFIYASHSRIGATITHTDALSGDELWQSPPLPVTSDSPYSFFPVFLEVRHRAGQAPLIISGGFNSHGRLIGVNALTHEVEWHVVDYDGGPLSSRRVHQGKVYDLDADGNDEIALCTIESGVHPLRVSVFDGRNGGQLWESAGLGLSPDQSCQAIAVGKFTDSGNPQIVVALPQSIEAFDGLTHQPSWSLPISAGGVWLIESGQIGREFVISQGPIIKFYDAATLNFLRQINLGGPISALRELDSNIHHLLVAVDGTLRVIDGVSGVTSSTSEYLGSELGIRDQLAVQAVGSNSFLVGAGSEAGAFRFYVRIFDEVFTNGFE